MMNDETERKSNRERWIEAMSRVPWSLVGYKGYTEQDARFVCQCFQESAPLHPKLSTVAALENETRDLPGPSSAIEYSVPESATKPKKSGMSKEEPKQIQCTHHWKIDSSNLGVCKYCGVKKQF